MLGNLLATIGHQRSVILGPLLLTSFARTLLFAIRSRLVPTDILGHGIIQSIFKILSRLGSPVFVDFLKTLSVLAGDVRVRWFAVLVLDQHKHRIDRAVRRELYVRKCRLGGRVVLCLAINNLARFGNRKLYFPNATLGRYFRRFCDGTFESFKLGREHIRVRSNNERSFSSFWIQQNAVLLDPDSSAHAVYDDQATG